MDLSKMEVFVQVRHKTLNLAHSWFRHLSTAAQGVVPPQPSGLWITLPTVGAGRTAVKATAPQHIVPRRARDLGFMVSFIDLSFSFVEYCCDAFILHHIWTVYLFVSATSNACNWLQKAHEPFSLIYINLLIYFLFM